MKRSFVASMIVLVGLAVASPRAYAQGGVTTTLTGTVSDASGGAIPGATAVVKNAGTGAIHNGVTNVQGVFVIPAISPGTYSVTVSLSGFKTAVLNDIVINAGVPASVRATLEVGGVTETVVVESATPIVQTVDSGVSATINVKQIQSLPLTSRNVLDFVTFLPGVSTPGGNRDSTMNGLPQSAINITLDGINVQDNTLKTTDGFFTIVQPRLDAIEEVTVSSAAQGADGGGQGAVQIKFVTRSGTNIYSGSVYNYFRSDTLNENTWFNNRNGVAIAKLKQNQTGGRFGGPIQIPGLVDGRGKAFFFVNMEEFRQPADVTRTRTILHPRAQEGWFRYGSQEINIFSVAAANGQTTTFDPTIQRLLADIRTATGTAGTVTDNVDPRFQNYNYNVATMSLNRYPTVRVDLNLTPSQRWSTTLNWHTFSSVPDTLNNAEPFFPGFPVMGSQTSTRIQFANNLRSTIGANLVNEARVGYSGAPVEFFNEQFDAGIWKGSVGNQGGYHLKHQRRRHHQRRSRAERAVTQRVDVPDRGHLELAEGLSQPQHRRLDDVGRCVAEEPDHGADGDSSASTPTTRRTRCSTPPTSRVIGDGSEQRAESLRGADGTHERPSTRTRGSTRRRATTCTRAWPSSAAACAMPGSSCRTAGASRPT